MWFSESSHEFCFCRFIFLFNDKFSSRHQQDDLLNTAIRSPFFSAARNGASASGWASALRVFSPEPRRAHAQPLAIVSSHCVKNSVLDNGGPARLVSRLSHPTCEYSGFHSECGLARVLTSSVFADSFFCLTTNSVRGISRMTYGALQSGVLCLFLARPGMKHRRAAGRQPSVCLRLGHGERQPSHSPLSVRTA